MATGVIKPGTRVRASFAAEVTRDYRSDKQATTRVSQTSGRGNHYLYLGSSLITGNKEVGGTVQVDFDAEVAGEFQEGPLVTTEVRELNRSGQRTGFTHYLYLNSEAVTMLEEAPAEPAGQTEPEPTPVSQPEPEPVPAPFAKGARIKVAIDGTIDGDINYARDSTTPVLQAGTRRTHFLFLGSELVNTEGDRREAGTQVSTRFDATVTDDYQENDGLTQVQEIRRLADGREYAGYTHYLYLDSSSVLSVLPPKEPDAVPEPEPAQQAVPEPEPVQRDVGGDRITPAAIEIESADILKRIAELEDAAPAAFRLVRNRTRGQLTPVFPSMTAALAYLEEEDLNPERFTVKEVKGELTGDDQKELDELRKLNDAGRAQFGSTPWITAGVLLRRDEECDEDWARDQARAELGVSYVDDWPLSLIDWSEAARDLLEADYLSVELDGTTYWGKYTG
jgi:hypothetical protein